MKTFTQYLKEKCWTGYKSVPGKKPYSKGSCTKEELELMEKMGDYASDADYHPEAKLGPKATKKQDTQEISRQKKNLDRLTHEYHKMSKDEGGGGMAKAHGDMFANAKKAIHSEEVVNEDGVAGMVGAPTNAAGGGVAGTGDSRLPSSQREPGVSKKRNPILQKLARRALPKV